MTYFVTLSAEFSLSPGEVNVNNGFSHEFLICKSETEAGGQRSPAFIFAITDRGLLLSESSTDLITKLYVIPSSNNVGFN